VTAQFLAADRFCLELDGLAAASFTRCSGLESVTSVLAYQEGGAAAPRALRGEPLPGSLVLERCLARDAELYEWFARGDRRDGAIVLLERDGREACRWRFRRGWPCSWEGPTLDAASAAMALERIEIAHEGLQWIVR
jgi:phage tail-like protein